MWEDDDGFDFVEPRSAFSHDDLMMGDTALLSRASGSSGPQRMETALLDPDYKFDLGYEQDVSEHAGEGTSEHDGLSCGIDQWLLEEQMQASNRHTGKISISRKFNLLDVPVFSSPENYSFALQAAYQQIPKRAKLLPLWETNPFLAPIFGHGSSFFPGVRLEGFPVQPEVRPPAVEITSNMEWVLSDRPTFTKAVSRAKDLSFEESEDVSRQKALNRMIAIFKSGPEFSDLGRRILAELGSNRTGHSSKIFSTVEDAVAFKATKTILSRTGAFLKYMFFCQQMSKPVWPLKEDLCYSYVDGLKRAGAAATKARSFIQAVGFMKGVLDPDGASEVLESTRCRGSSFVQAVKKRRTKRRRKLKAKEVAWLETVCDDSPDYFDRNFSGFYLFLLYGRARRGDTNSVSRIIRDFRGRSEGFLQIEAGDIKTGNTAEKKSLLLPLTAPRQGLRSKPWADSWMAAREFMGLPLESEDGKSFALMPAPDLKGGFGKRPLSSSETRKWLIEILRLGEPDGPSDPELLGGHSARATGLSWAAQIGVKAPVRKFLGYHIDPGEVVMATYGRDNAAEPLRQFSKILSAIRAGLFDPDDTRSGYLHGALAQMGFDKWYPGAEFDTDAAERAAAADTESDSSSDTSSSESEGSSSSDESTDADEAAASLGEKLAPLSGCTKAELQSGMLYFHSVFTTVHKLRVSSESTFVCGRVLRVGYKKLEGQTFDWPKCRSCFPP